MLSYFFKELRYQKCNVGVYDFNVASIKLHENLGFQHEGRPRRIYFSGGEYHDGINLGITSEEYEQHA